MSNALGITLEGQFSGYLQSLMSAGTITEREAKRMAAQLSSISRILQQNEKAQKSATAAVVDSAKSNQAADKIATAAKSAGLSVGQMNNALRNTPAQLTDIATQLAGGQSPFLIMIQQGGQMRDMFGGFGNMFKGLATIITPARVAFTGIAAAVGGLLYTYLEGKKDQEAFSKSMMLTGGYAGMTSSSFAALAENVSKSTTITVGAARDIGNALIKTGRVGPDNLGPMSIAIAKVAAISGESAESLVSDFAKMSDGVAKWAAEHNRQYHFLTLAEYNQIAAAEKAGDKNKAVGLTLEALNGKLKESKGFWDELAQSVGGYWEKLKKAAGPSTSEDKASSLRADLNALRNRDGRDEYSSYRQRVVTVAQQRELLRAQIKAIEDQEAAKLAAAESESKASAVTEKAIADKAEQDDKSKKATERAQSAIESTIASLEDEGARLNAQAKNWKIYHKAIDDSTLAVLNLDVARGKYKGASDADIKRAQGLATANDQAKKAIALAQQAEEAAKKAAAKEEAYAKSKAGHTLAIDKEIASMRVEAAMVGKTTEEREIATAAIKVHADAEAMLAQHAEKAGDIAAWEAEQIAKVTQAIQQRNAINQDPQTGVDRALAKYKEDAGNVAKYTENMISGGLSRMEDAVVSFVHTGKLSFGSLWEFMADEFIKQQLRMVVAGQSGGAGGLLGWLAGLGGASSSVSTVPGSSVSVSDTPMLGSPTLAANGYDYVPRDNTPFLLHQGERVLTAAENSKYTQGGQPMTVVNHIGQGVNRAEVMAAIAQSMEAVKAQILSSRQHRGAFA
jgi:lambda family phage tail tape measure protein